VDDGLRLPEVDGGLLDALTPQVEATAQREAKDAQAKAPTPLPIVLFAWACLAAGLYWAWTLEALAPLGVVLVFFLLVVPFERLFPRHQQPLRRPRMMHDVSHALLAPVSGVLAGAAVIVVAVVSLAWIPGLLLRPLVAMIPDGPRLVVGVLLFDLTVYWTHRFYHEVPFLWRFHQVHHSTEHLDWVSGFRAHPLDGALLAPAFVFLITAGFSPEFGGILAVLQALLGLFLHANVRLRLRPLHPLIITPEFHHWHHSSHEEARWSNYSTFLPVWDLVFRTYHMPKDARPSRYGIDTPMPVHVVQQWVLPFRGLGNPWYPLRHPFKALRRLVTGVRSLLRDMRWSMTRRRDQTPFGRPVVPDPSDLRGAVQNEGP